MLQPPQLPNSLEVTGRRALVLLALAACAHRSPESGSTAAFPNGDASRIDSLAVAAMQGVPAAGQAVVAMRGHTVIWARGYGYANLEDSTVATSSTVFRVGSITKQFTAALVLRLVREHQVRLDAPIDTYLSGLTGAAGRVTVHQLLSHTSGLPDFVNTVAWRGVRERVVPLDSIDRIVADFVPQFAPGSAWAYSNTNYFLLGRLVERVTHERYEVAVQRRLLEPLGLTSTSFCGTRQLVPRRAQGYQPDSAGRLGNAEHVNPALAYAAGALCSTADDLAAWTQALHSGRVLDSVSYRAMITSAEPPGSRTRYGYGVRLNPVEGHRRVDHGGGISGFVSSAAWYPDDSVLVVVLTNTQPSAADALSEDIARVMLRLPLRPLGLRP